MGKRNAHAVKAWARKAGAHSSTRKPAPEDRDLCTECGCPMGFNPPHAMCAPCALAEAEETVKG